MAGESIPSTEAHIKEVQNRMDDFLNILIIRRTAHDLSKLGPPELEHWDEFGKDESLKEIAYGSPEYMERMKKLKPALDHHFSINRHHPEYFGDDLVMGMNLIDLIEMLSDWKAASKRYKSDITFKESLKKSQERFKFSDDIRIILENTVDYLNW